jgi:CcmD family protein
MKRIFVTLISLLAFTLPVLAQTTTDVEMADAMRSNGKIFVVIAVICILFAFLFIYLISIDRKVSKLEKEIKK